MGEAAVQTYGHSRPRLAELGLVVLLVYHTFIGGATYGLYVFYPRLITQLILVGLIASWLVTLWLRKRPFPASPIDVPLLGLGILIVISAVLSREPYLSLQDVPLYLSYVLIYYMVVERLSAGWSPLIFAKALMLTAAVACLFGLLEYLAWYLGLPLFPAFAQSWWQIGGWQHPLPPTWYRLQYTLNNPNFLASLLACTLPLGAATAVASRSGWTRLNAVVWSALVSLVLLMTFSRGGLIAAAAGLLTLAVLLGLQRARVRLTHRPTHPPDRWKPILIGTGLVVIASLALAFLIIRGLPPELRRSDGDAVRTTLWRYALDVVRDHPVIGVGPRAFGMAVLDYWDPARDPMSRVFFGTAHNVLLQAVAELGIPGGILVTAIGALVFHTGYGRFRRLAWPQQVWAAGFLAALVAFAVHSMVDMVLAVPAVTMPIILLAGMCSSGVSAPPALSHPWLTPARGLAVTGVMAALVGWSLIGLAATGASAFDARAGQWESAISRLEHLPGGSLPTSYLHAQLGLLNGRVALDTSDSRALEAAIGHYTQLLDRHPRYVPARANLAALYWRQGNLTAARDHLAQAAAQMPDDPVYAFNLGLLAEQDGDDAGAVAWYARALLIAPSSAAAAFWQASGWRVRHWPAIVQRARSGNEMLDPNSETILRRAQLAYYTGDMAAAAELLHSILDSEARIEAQRWLTRVMLAQGQYREALIAFDDLFRQATAPGRAEDYLYRGRAWLGLGSLNAAERDYRTAIFLGYSEAYADLAQIALRAGDVAAAINHYRHALAPPRGVANINLNFDFLFFRQASLIESNLLPIAAVPPSSSQVAIYLQLADLYAAQGRTAEARQVCVDLLTLVPGYPAAIERLDKWRD
jgi:putative inorganic carbon (HCO3(-)) transporter